MDAFVTSSLTVLGAFALRVGDREVTGLPRKAQAFVAYLAMQPDRRVPREAIADLLWTNSGPDQARHSLRQMLVVLRRTPVGDLIRVDTDALWIEPGAIAVDALALEAGLTATDDMVLSDCVALYRGALLDGFPQVSPGFDEWLRPERARLAGIAARILRRLVAVRCAAGAFDAAIESAAYLVGMDTLDEASHRLLMECLARAGRRAEALRQADVCARILREELDVAPDAETVALASRIEAGDWPAWTATNDAIPAPVDTPPAATPVPAPPRRSRYPLAWAVAMLAVVAGSVGVFALRQSKPPAPPPSAPPPPAPGLVISDFASIVGIASSNAVAGFLDLIRLDLATRQHVRLIDDPAGDAKQAAPTRDRARRDAGGRYLLDGSAAFEQTMVRVTARLTDIRDGRELWSDHYDRSRIDVQQVADDIATHAARAVSQDRDVAVQSPAAPFRDAPAAARHLIALSHQTDYYVAGPNAPSRQIYRLALQLDNNNVEILAHLANSYIREAVSRYPFDQAALAEADSILRRALPLDPTNLYALFDACMLRHAQKRIPESMELCRRVLDIDPNYPGALRVLGHDLLLSGDAAQAIVSYQASLAAAPFLPFVYNAFKGLGVASLALGRHDDAIGYLQKAIDSDKSYNDDEQLWMALVLETDGQHAEADEHLTAFLDRNPRLEVDAGYLALLSAPAFADTLDQMLAAFARINARIGPRPSPAAAADAK